MVAPTTQAATNQDIQQASAQGQALQNQYNQQSSQLQGQYGTDVNQANSAYNQLQGFTQNMQSGGQMYTNALQQAQNQYGYNPQTTQKAAQGLTTAENIMNALPQATQQMGNYSGATAGQVAQNYSNMAGNISGQVTNANNSLQNQLGIIGAAQNQANQQATLGVQTQGQQAQSYQALYQNATQQMQAAGQTMAQIEALQANQGYLTSEQVSNYQTAYNGYISAQASAEAASAQMVQAQASASQINQQVAQLNAIQQAFKQLYGNNWAMALQEVTSGKSVNVPTTGTSAGVNFNNTGLTRL